MLAEDARVYAKFKDRLSAEDFCVDIHKQIYGYICKFYEESINGKCEDYLLANMQGCESELSTVFLSIRNVTNNSQAAEDFIGIIEDEAFNEKLQQAQAEGDIARISELLKSKKQKS